MATPSAAVPTTAVTTPPLTLTLDPIKYLNNLPSYDGSRDKLYTFIDLVDRIFPTLGKYDEPSQLIFFDILKSKITGKAREAIEINNTVKNWDEVKRVFFQYFGDRKSIEQLYDELRAIPFRSNCQEYHNDLKAMLRRLNNKVRIARPDNFAVEVEQNCKAALNLFINKIPEPMKGLLHCRNPNNLEEAIQILFEAGYAYVRSNTWDYNRHHRPNIRQNNTQTHSGQHRYNSGMFRTNRNNDNERPSNNGQNNQNNHGTNQGPRNNNNPFRNNSGNFRSNSENFRSNSGNFRNRENNSGNYRNELEPMDTLSGSYARQIYNTANNPDFQAKSLPENYPI